MREQIKAKITNFLAKSQIIENDLLRYAYSTDARLYMMVPELVLIVKNEDEFI
ncbi:hypothetical protein [Francisella tularensis]|uniref:hypothetical protein n=1 Tax=Francisella tularensis TaxID=263 RepID=UPI002381961A|nr:hypothetical protein [Francisella tularensis]MDE5037843.1 hypothetical protein [Francisella tularensis subsp. holarctica]